MKNLLIKLSGVAILLAAIVSCSGNGKKSAGGSEPAPQVENKQEKIMEQLKNLPSEPVFDMVTSMGTIRIRLYSKTPKHRDNFAKLALSGYYDGLLFHRVIDGFMIQGGDPLTKDPANKGRFGTGGPSYTVPAEIIPEYRHKKGALAAARRGDAANPMRESSGSQFYLVQDENNCAQLDGAYTVYGQTLSGFEVIDAIAKVDRDYRDCPLENVKIISVKLVKE